MFNFKKVINRKLNDGKINKLINQIKVNMNIDFYITP